MKIAVCSDLHLEFGDLDLTNDAAADVLILSGDILVASDLTDIVADPADGWMVNATKRTRERGLMYNDFIVRCCARFPQVILIMGNHEHYHGDFANTAKIIRSSFGDLKNLHFLDKQHVIIDGVLFYGGTAWTDMNREDPVTMLQIRNVMNDYLQVKNSARMVSFRVPDVMNGDDGAAFKQRPAYFSPADSVEDHYAFRRGLDDTLEKFPNMPVVVVGHHAPSKASTHPRYKTEFMMNGAYSSNLDEFILDRRQIRVWTHGHTHEEFDYMIGTTRIVCNPRGYIGYEDRADDFKLKYVEI